MSELNELHREALDRLPRGEWRRLREFTDRPEVARDLCACGYLDTRRGAVGRSEVVYYARK
jgi:hypothetical protein